MENYTEKQEEKTEVLSVVPLRGKIAFPNNLTSFEVGRDITFKAIEYASNLPDKKLFVCSQRQTEKSIILAGDFYTVGTVAKINKSTQLPGGILRVIVEGLYRARIRSVRFENGCYFAEVEELESVHGDEELEAAYFRTAKAMALEVLGEGKIGKDILSRMDVFTDPDVYINMVVAGMRVRLEAKQELLEECSVIERLKLFERFLGDEQEIANIEKKISSAVRQSIERSQKDYFLREQLKAIHNELGDSGKEEDEYRDRVRAKKLPEEVEKKCLKELDRLAKMQTSSPECSVITSYIDWILDLPWREETEDTEKLADCAAVLDADHYGLEKIKERVTEYLAVLKLTKSMKAPILCFVGPPGVGKTSIARSIARALGRKFVRMSLGGVRDEAEIRGHRRTYIGSMPGRILYAMKSAGSVNPVFLLDEVDKISSDMRGDPASALLEVLDPEQNSTFRDRYLEVPYDLSKVMFITTANTLETVPGALRDRMEVIELSGYTREEKCEIAKRYLVPKQLSVNGLNEKNAEFTDDAINSIIEGYTMEAGVRALERNIGAVCRKIAVKYADDERVPKVTVDKAKVTELLGAPRFNADEARKEEEVGAATGLAWTVVGGTTLTVEASIMHGKGETNLTGKLGDVMKESALAAISFIRSHADKYGIPADKFETTDIHIHVPEGATPKDGPSAGVTIATAILSAFTGRPVRKDVAMTGEITLRGKVLPVGGLKEKVLAARRIGIENIIIPSENKKDVEEIPASVRGDLTFIPVTDADEVFAFAVRGLKESDGAKSRQAKPKRVTRPKKEPVIPVGGEDIPVSPEVRCKS